MLIDADKNILINFWKFSKIGITSFLNNKLSTTKKLLRHYSKFQNFLKFEF